MAKRTIEDEIADFLGEDRPTRDEARAKMKQRVLAMTASGLTLRKICRQPGAPSVRTVNSWVESDLEFAEEYRKAKTIGFDAIAQECLDIADSGSENDVKHRTLRINTRLKLLSRWDMRYSDRLAVVGDPNNPVRVLTNDEVMREVMALLATAKERQLHDPNNRVRRELLN